MVRARGDQGADPLEQFGARAVEVWNPDADRLGIGAREPAKAPGGIGQDQRDGTREQQACERRRPAAQLGNALEQVVEVRRDERARLIRVPALELVEQTRPVLTVRVGGKAVDRVERHHDGLS